jgi:3-keto-5-aminohexanoate cleavage enzyme
MEKLVITITADSTMSYPRNPHNPQGLENIAEEYRRSVDAGASILHLHGPYTFDKEFQPDGTKLSDLDLAGWQKLADLIKGKCSTNPVIQYGIANGRFPQRVELMDQKPDMMSICFNAHDECFQPDPNFEPVELCGLHSRPELTEYAKLTSEKGIKPEIESFHFGAVWNAMRLYEQGLLKAPMWTTLFFWPAAPVTASVIAAFAIASPIMSDWAIIRE